ncbi:MAG: hypothetical protein PHT32_09250, partial [Candidatus Omnitrophica bacterium]|nr:hypothetical protein [Candidatus Omnitrophota bacterium]
PPHTPPSFLFESDKYSFFIQSSNLLPYSKIFRSSDGARLPDFDCVRRAGNLRAVAEALFNLPSQQNFFA